MRYHYLRGTGKRARRRRLWQAGAAGLAVIIACSTTLALRSQSGESEQASAAQETKVAVSSSGLRVAANCGTGEGRRAGLAESSVGQLRKLAEYEQVCNGAVSNANSFFIPVPVTNDEAQRLAAQTIRTLQEFAKYNLSPVVFLEPRLLNGQVANLEAYASGSYDDPLNTFFAEIRDARITDAQMGMWVPIPEGNTPAWGNPSPELFTQMVSRTLHQQKKYFPTSRASVLLESKSYATANWGSGAYTSLLPYVQNIPPGQLDSLGLQGFPWGPSDSGRTAELNPEVYLRTDLAIEAARTANLPRVWLNTGTFGTFAKDTATPFTATPVERQRILEGVLAAAQTVQQADFSTAIHLFAKNKADTPERVDWSYWPTGAMAGSPGASIFKTLVYDARQAQIPLWVYDY